MAQNKKLNIQPAALTTSAADYLNSTITTLTGGVGWVATQPYILLRHVRAINTGNAAASVTMYKGLSGGSAPGTEYMWCGKNIPPNDSVEWFGEMRLDAADFLSGLASVATVTLNFDSAEVGFS
jgi:hypothetical protein